MSNHSHQQSKQLKQLRKAIVRKPPYCSGAVSVPADELSLYYGKGEQARQINFSVVTDDALKHLSETCTPAMFGRNDEDVLDESYRKAGELSNTEFAVKLNLDKDGLMDIIRVQLLEGRDAQRPIHAELYKINVYGEGSFFKSHKDTPRNSRMFGSLVIIYPTRHAGGSLIFRDGKDKWTFDSAQAGSAQEGPCIAYAAFFGDVDHEVARVDSGYRVTVTYNLFYGDPVVHIRQPSVNRLKFQSKLENLLAEPTFLPEGGRLGFGLRRVYPLNKKPSNTNALDYLRDCLKGSDAEIMRVCDDLSLKANLWMLYRHYGDTGIISQEPELHNAYLDEQTICEYLRDEVELDVKRVNDFTVRASWDIRDDDTDDSQSDSEVELQENKPTDNCDPTAPRQKEESVDWIVHWVTKPSAMNAIETPVVSYGNHAELEYVYGFITMIVEVGKPGERATNTDSDSERGGDDDDDDGDSEDT